MSDPLISLEHINYRIGGRSILHDICLPIESGELLTIVGPNGAGKSTLMRLILGHYRPSSGSITRRKGLRLAYVPQSFHTPSDLPISMRRFLKGLDYQQADSPLDSLNIRHLLDSPLQNLSGGETQRLLLARAMLNRPELIVLDEPAAGIDPSALGNYYHHIRDYQLKTRCAIVLVSHDLHLVMAASDKVLCLNGHICCMGKPQEIARHPDFLRLLGQAEAAELGIYHHHHNHQHL